MPCSIREYYRTHPIRFENIMMTTCPICEHSHLGQTICLQPVPPEQLMPAPAYRAPLCRCAGNAIWESFSFNSEQTAREVATQLERAGFTLYLFTTNDALNDPVVKMVDNRFLCSVFTEDPKHFETRAAVQQWCDQVQGVVSVMQRPGQISCDDLQAHTSNPRGAKC